MSSYVDSALSEGEHIVYRANVSHWKYFPSYLLGLLFLLAAAAACCALSASSPTARQT